MITIYFAPPGVGKTCLAAKLSWREHFLSKFKRSHYDRVYANFPCKYTYEFDKSCLGNVDMRGLVIIDEISIDWNNRRYKEMTQQTIQYLKLHRHYKSDSGLPTDIVAFSQSYEDMDVTFRRLCTRMYLLKRCWFWPYTVKALRITKSIGIDDTTHAIVDAYAFDNLFVRLFTTKRFYLPFYWHMFDSWDAPKLPSHYFTYHP